MDELLLRQFRKIVETLDVNTYEDNDYDLDRDFHAGKNNNITYWVDLDNGHSLGLLAVFPTPTLDQLGNNNLPIKYVGLMKNGLEIGALSSFDKYNWKGAIEDIKQSYKASLKQIENGLQSNKENITQLKNRIEEFEEENSGLTAEIKELLVSHSNVIKRYEAINFLESYAKADNSLEKNIDSDSEEE